MATHDYDRLLTFLRNGMYEKPVIQCCNENTQRKFFKRGAEASWAGTPHVQLPCQQGKRIVGTICAHLVKLGKLIKKVQSKVISWPQCSCAEWRVQAVVCSEGSGLGTVHLRLSKARLSPLPW